MILRIRKKLILILTVILLSAVLNSCGKLGTGVIFWPPENSPWEPGDLVTVKDESLLRKTYIVNLPGQRRLKEEVEKWRIKLFKSEKDAREWADSLGEWRYVFAQCMYQGLPMRNEPSNISDRIYRFRDGDIMKVINRLDGPVKVGNLEGYWYNVITSDGVEGYVFDYYLKVMKIKDGKTTVLNYKEIKDASLENLLSAPYYPKVYEEMVDNNQINLNLLKPDYGFFPDRENKTLSIKLPEYSFSETWSDIIHSGPNRYDFLGTSFRITVNSDNFISIQYNYNGEEHYEAFIRLKRSISDIIQSEKERRMAVIENLIEKGPVFTSSAYGEITFYVDGSFTWSGKSALISRNILSSSAGNKGRLIFDYYMDPTFAAFYDGVLSMEFENGKLIHFLYKYENNGLRLIYVPENVIDNHRIRTDQYISQIILFFKPQKTEVPENSE